MPQKPEKLCLKDAAIAKEVRLVTEQNIWADMSMW